ncbi:hypothetical protein C2S52_012877 [Perilla frutescens var. hirtella]|nr:hypothetical protein C2S51_015237 [Perilla frutescens var. frutescens]KAH6775316.1 hypothetical protein C2S52_012877 [Perilla frutescens var. hirtella]
MAEGAVKFLLEQLSVWLREQKKLLGGLEEEVKYIRDELEQMREFLRVADANEESNPNLKEWVRQVREISYDVQDVLDKYDVTNRSSSGYVKKVYASITKLKAQQHIASEIRAIKSRLDNVSRNQQRYREMYAVVDLGSSSTLGKTGLYDGRGDALFLEEADVVGIEKSKEKLLEWIKLRDDGLEVISVVGMGGLGKTTLVKKVYDDESVKRCFNRHVWIVDSDYMDVKHLLANMIKKLVGEIKESPPQELEGMSVDDMRNFVYQFLEGKNYIIVLDDVWDASRWEAIRFALPRRCVRGCIIITTRCISIANAACSDTDHVHNLEPLPDKESRELFYKKAFPRNPCPPYIREYAENILKRCEGLPLAIVVIGGLLATKNDRAEEWELFNRSLSDELEVGNLPRLSRLLSLSYNDLPHYLKYCFLYLSIFPGSGLLEKEKIIRLWIAEGFVRRERSKTSEEVADSYLNELHGRSLMQVAEKGVDGRARAFRIHDLLREYIVSKSRELNVATVFNGGEMQWPNKIRRLAIQNSINFCIDTNNFEYLRSLLVFCNENKDFGLIKELISRCRILKVLDLRGAPLETIPNGVFKLYHLKHLCLRDTMVRFIPKSIRNLENLETLDLKNSNVTELPVEILKLSKLRYLIAYKSKNEYDDSFDNIQSFKAPYELGSCMLSLQKLCCIDADEVDGIKIVREIGKLTQLRRLSIAKVRSKDGKELCSSIAKLTNLRSLRIHSFEEREKLDLDYSLSSAGLPFLRKLDIIGCTEKLPHWIPSLNALTTLNLCWSKLREDPLKYLQNLPNLARLKIHDAYVEELCFRAPGFQKLGALVIEELKCLKGVMVEKGSMPCLKEWLMSRCCVLAKLPQGMEHLTNLENVSFNEMGDEFVEGVFEESWRVDHVHDVRFNTVIDNNTHTQHGYGFLKFAIGSDDVINLYI